MRHDDVEEARHPTDRAIAVEGRHGLIDKFGNEPHCPTMASPFDVHAPSRRTAMKGAQQEGRAGGASATFSLKRNQRAATTAIGAPRLASCDPSFRALASTFARHARTWLEPTRSALEAVPHTSVAALTSR